jgi:hypothetical protein
MYSAAASPLTLGPFVESTSSTLGEPMVPLGSQQAGDEVLAAAFFRLAK